MSRHSLMAFLDDPTRAWLVLIVGILLVYRECIHPGRVLPGVAGGVAITLALYAIFRRPWSGLALTAILAGVSLLVAQAFRARYYVPVLGAALLITAGVHWLTTPGIGILPALAAIPLSVITALLLRTAILARRRKLFDRIM